MVFERQHCFVDKNVPIGEIADICGRGGSNNTNASSYINGIRMQRKAQELQQARNQNGSGILRHFDPQPID